MFISRHQIEPSDVAVPRRRKICGAFATKGESRTLALNEVNWVTPRPGGIRGEARRIGREEEEIGAKGEPRDRHQSDIPSTIIEGDRRLHQKSRGQAPAKRRRTRLQPGVGAGSSSGSA
jgi:hypothetical protein